MNKKISIGFAISIAAIIAAITFILTTSYSLQMYNDKIQSVKERAEVYKKLDEIDNYVRANFLGSVKDQQLIDRISQAYMVALDDKYARYTSAEDSKKEKSEDNGVVIGIGVSVTQDKSGYILISDITPNSPAQESNLQANDLIVAVNGVSVLTDGYEKSVKNIYGDAGTAVNVTIRSQGVDKEVSLTRREIVIESVTSRMIGDIAYIKISEFNTKTYDQFNSIIKNVTSSGAKGIIFDVRNNPGGLLDPTIKMLDILLPSGEIASATYKDGSVKSLGTSDSNEVNLPMVVLTNSRTASAAELFSSALRDYQKAQLVGATTFGKGIMQNTYELLDGSAVTFTVAKYQTSQTPNFNGVGLKPNYEVIIQNDTAPDLAKLNETSDAQLKKGLEVLKTSVK